MNEKQKKQLVKIYFDILKGVSIEGRNVGGNINDYERLVDFINQVIKDTKRDDLKRFYYKFGAKYTKTSEVVNGERIYRHSYLYSFTPKDVEDWCDKELRELEDEDDGN